MGRLQITQLKTGMVIGENIYDKDSGKLVLNAGARLTDSVIQRLIRYHFEDVEVDDPYTLFLTPDDNIESILKDTYNSAVNMTLSNRPEGCMNDHAFQCGLLVRELIPEIVDNAILRKSCSNMQIVDSKLLLRTGVFVSVYAMMIAAVLNLDKEEILHIGMAGLLHDIGMCEMPYLIGVADLPDNMKALYHEHPTYAYYMMKEREYPEDICEMVYAHHERFDGEGFPRKLAGSAIPLGGRIIGLCSDYEALLHIHKMAPYEAIEYMYGNSGFCYDKTIVQAFTENISIYNMGSMVELTTGEIGLIVNIRKNKGPRPIVRIFYNRVKKEISQPYIMDLGQEKTVFIRKVISAPQ